jgi:hypothetical protein
VSPLGPFVFFWCPSQYLGVLLAIPFVLFKAPKSATTSPRTRSQQCSDCSLAAMSYRYAPPCEGRVKGECLSPNSYRRSPPIHWAVIILRRRVRPVLLGTHLFHSNFTPVIEQPPASVNGAFWRHCRPTASLLPVSALQSVAYVDAARSNLPSVSVAAVRPPRSFTATDLAFGEDFAR